MPTASAPASKVTEQLSSSAAGAFHVEQYDERTFAISTPFMGIYGDPIVLHLMPGENGSWLLTDNGETRHQLNDFKGYDTYRKLGPMTLQFWLTETELFQTQVGEGHELMTFAHSDDLSSAVFRLLQSIMHISGLGMVDND